MGQKIQFEAGFAVGAVPVGYRLVEVPEAGLNKKGNPKTKPEIVPEVKELIIKHFKMIATGTSLAEGCRLWNAEISGWPDEIRRYAIDGRAKSKTMRPEAYRRMFSRGLYRGECVFGQKRNHWLERKEQIVQKDAPEQEVSRQHREHLRIVPDELFLQVQERLADEPRGKHGPRLDKEPPLSSALINLFHCAECGRSFYSYGTQYAHCPGSSRGECSSWGTIDREMATKMTLSALRDHIRACSGLVAEVVEKSRKLDMAVDSDNYAERRAALQQSIRRQNQLLLNIAECFAETGMDAEAKQRQREVTREKLRLEAELATLTSQNENPRRPVTEEQVTALLKDFDTILADAGSGQLGGEAKQRAVSLIRHLTGGRIAVSFIRLKGRRRAFGVGHFTPSPMTALVKEGGLHTEVDVQFPEVRLEFRELPRYARIADDVYRLYAEGEGLSMTEIAKQFECKSGNVWEAYAYWHTSRGLEVPIKRPGMRERKNK